MSEFNTRWDDNTVVTVGVTLDGKVGIVIDDGQEEGCGLATPAEWDAFVAAGNAALGREVGPTVPRAAVEALRAEFDQWVKFFDAAPDRAQVSRMARAEVDKVLAAATGHTPTDGR